MGYELVLCVLAYNKLFVCAPINGVEMRKQRKMGHITFVGPSMGIVEARLNALLTGESLDSQTAGQFLCGVLMINSVLIVKSNTSFT